MKFLATNVCDTTFCKKSFDRKRVICLDGTVIIIIVVLTIIMTFGVVLVRVTIGALDSNDCNYIVNEDSN